MNRNKVSVVTVCRNCSAMLEKTIHSVATLTYPNLEYIVVDGNSVDDTLSIIKKYESVISQWVSEPDKGIYDAMNKAVKMAKGDWIIFMNAGDLFASSECIAKAMEEAEDNDIIYGDVIKGEGVVIRAGQWHNAHRMLFCHQSVFVRTELLRQYPFDIKHRMSADFKFFKIVGKNGARFAHIDIPVSIFDTSGVSNARRSKGLADNMSVVCECDSFLDIVRFMPKLLFPYMICRLRGK